MQKEGKICIFTVCELFTPKVCLKWKLAVVSPGHVLIRHVPQCLNGSTAYVVVYVGLPLNHLTDVCSLGHGYVREIKSF